MQLNELSPLLEAIIGKHGRPDYTTWLKICSGVWSEFGFDESFPILNSLMPEEHTGEYLRKYNKRLKNVTLGTVVHMARQCGYTGKFTGNKTVTSHKTECRLPEICRDEPEKVYNVVEIVSDGAFNRPGEFRQIKSISELDAHGHPGLVDVYHSIYWHSEDLPRYAEANQSISGYDQACKASVLHFDFDCKEDPQKALEDVRSFLERVCIGYDVLIDAVQIWFTGNKGFSVFVKDQSILNSPGAVDIPDRIKKICSEIAEGFNSFDHTPYDRCRIWRMPNTINSKSGLYKIPILAGEVFTLNIDQIRARARNQRSMQDAIQEFLSEGVHHG